jgi:hypothetical protein
MPAALLLSFLAVRALSWSDFTPAMQRVMIESGVSPEGLPRLREEIEKRNERRLREGEIEHLVNYVLHSREFTNLEPVLAARAALDTSASPLIRSRVAAFVAATQNATSETLRYLGSLLPVSGREDYVNAEVQRVLRWTQEKEVGCASASNPQHCIAGLFQIRGHSSDTGAQSIEVVRAALNWLGSRPMRHILIIGPGVDIAGRTGTSSNRSYQPQFLREISPRAVSIDCVDLNPRVVQAVAGACDSTAELDISVHSVDAKYDLVIATNVLLYLNQQELLLAFANIATMVADGGSLIHNDARFEANVFGRAAGIPVVHFGSVILDASRRPVLTDRFVIHSRSAPKDATVRH